MSKVAADEVMDVVLVAQSNKSDTFSSLFHFWMFLFQVQSNKQVLSSLTRRNRDKTWFEPYRIPDPASKINAKWSNEELLLGVQGT